MPEFRYGLLLPSQIVLGAPSEEGLITLAEAKLHLKVEGNDEDSLIQGLIDASIDWIDGPQGWLGRALNVQTITEYRDCFWARPLTLSYPPVRSITSIGYLDGSGVAQIVPSDSYEAINGAVDLVWGKSWPSTAYRERGIRIVYEAGYDELPAAIKVACLMMIGFLYENREATTDEALHSGAVMALLSPYRIWRV